MKLKQLASVMGIGLGLALAASSVQADSLWQFQDDDIEFILTKDSSGNYVPKTSGNLAVGDVFWAILELPTFTINGNNAIPAGKEVTGVAGIELKNIIPSSAPGGSGTVYQFGAFTDFQTVLTANGGPNLSSLVPAGATPAVALFINNATNSSGTDRNLILDAALNPASNCTSLSDCTTEATQGSLLQLDGFGLDADEFWTAVQIASGGGNIGNVLSTNNTVQVAGFNFAISNFFNQAMPVLLHDIISGVVCAGASNDPLNPDGCIQVSGNGNVLGGQGLTNGAIAHSDLDAKKYVPEPTSLALLGIGLLGLGARVRRFA